MSRPSVERFWQRFDNARGDLAIRQVEKRAGAPRGRIGNAYSNRREPTILIIESITAGLYLNTVEVLSWAGVVSSSPDDDGKQREDELTRLFRQMTSHEQDLMLVQFRAVVADRKRQNHEETDALSPGETSPAGI